MPWLSCLRSSSYQSAERGAPRSRLVAVVREGPVRFGHAVRILAPLDRCARAVGGIKQFSRQLFLHGLAGARLGGVEQPARSEEHTSELQSRSDLVCRLLLEKKKK